MPKRSNVTIFIDKIYAPPPKKYYITNKTEVYHTDDTWSLDLLDLNEYGPENNGGGWVGKGGSQHT